MDKVCEKTSAFPGFVVRTVPKKTATLSVLAVVATTELGAIDKKSTKTCFTDSSWTCRDHKFGKLPNQPEVGPCIITTLVFQRSWSLLEGAAAVLGVRTDMGSAELGRLLVERGHTMTLPQVQEILDGAERSGALEPGSFFFTETGDAKNPVSVGFVSRDKRGRVAVAHSLGDLFRWNPFNRLMVRHWIR